MKTKLYNLNAADALFSAAVSCRNAETVIATESGNVLRMRAVNIPFELPPVAEVYWRCRSLYSDTHLIPHPDRYPDDISEAVEWALERDPADILPGEPEALEEALSAARSWDGALREKLNELMSDIDADHVAVIRGLSIRPSPEGWQYDPLHAYRLLLLKAAASPDDTGSDHVTNDIDMFLQRTSEPGLRPLVKRDLNSFYKAQQEANNE